MDYYFKIDKRLTTDGVRKIFKSRVKDPVNYRPIFTNEAIRILNKGGYLYLDTSRNIIKGYDTFSILSRHNDTSLNNLKYITLKHNIKYNKELN